MEYIPPPKVQFLTWNGLSKRNEDAISIRSTWNKFYFPGLECGKMFHMEQSASQSATPSKVLFHVKHFRGTQSRRQDLYVPRGTTLWVLCPISTAKDSVPRETSCILDMALLNFRSRETVGSNHRDCEPKRRSWQDNHGGELGRLSRHG